MLETVNLTLVEVAKGLCTQWSRELHMFDMRFDLWILVQQWLQESLGEFRLKGFIVVATLLPACAFPLSKPFVWGQSDDFNRSLARETGFGSLGLSLMETRDKRPVVDCYQGRRGSYQLKHYGLRLDIPSDCFSRAQASRRSY